MRSHGNIKECAETAEFRLHEHGLKWSRHVPHAISYIYNVIQCKCIIHIYVNIYSTSGVKMFFTKTNRHVGMVPPIK